MLMKVMLAVMLWLIAGMVEGRRGADVTEDVQDMGCLKNEGLERVIIRCYRSYGAVDPNCKGNVQRAYKAGLSSDIYIYPCVPCGRPDRQVQDMLLQIREEDLGTVWIIVEQYKWSKQIQDNRNFLGQMVSAITQASRRPGIFSTQRDWEAIVGPSWQAFAHLPLWYENCDKNPSFDDFKPFGGWTRPTAKRYQCNPRVCNQVLNLDYLV